MQGNGDIAVRGIGAVFSVRELVAYRCRSRRETPFMMASSFSACSLDAESLPHEWPHP